MNAVQKCLKVLLMLAFAVSALTLAGCCGDGGSSDTSDSRWEEGDKGSDDSKADKKDDKKAEKKDKASGSDAAPIKGSAFNAFFPDDGVKGTKRVFTQEKEGYAEAKFTRDGEDVAKISISDASDNAKARGKFEGASDKVQGFPMMTRGKNSSMVLVNDRFQVKVSSKTLDADTRKQWLGQVKLSGLSKL